jgi:hypothetical protein
MISCDLTRSDAGESPCAFLPGQTAVENAHPVANPSLRTQLRFTLATDPVNALRRRIAKRNCKEKLLDRSIRARLTIACKTRRSSRHKLCLQSSELTYRMRAASNFQAFKLKAACGKSYCSIAEGILPEFNNFSEFRKLTSKVLVPLDGVATHGRTISF